MALLLKIIETGRIRLSTQGGDPARVIRIYI
jgi:hypothetical protein